MNSQASWTFRLLFNDALNVTTGGWMSSETFQPCLSVFSIWSKFYLVHFHFFFKNLTHLLQLVLPMLFVSSQGRASQEEMALLWRGCLGYCCKKTSFWALHHTQRRDLNPTSPFLAKGHKCQMQCTFILSFPSALPRLTAV